MNTLESVRKLYPGVKSLVFVTPRIWSYIYENPDVPPVNIHDVRSDVMRALIEELDLKISQLPYTYTIR